VRAQLRPRAGLTARRYQTVATLLQYYLFIPLVQKDVHLVALCNSLAQNSIMVFTRTVHDAQRCVRPGAVDGSVR
jgi:superfamily II DNA/RNA helicase